MFAALPQTSTSASSQIVLGGNCGYEINNGKIILNISEIANQRIAGDISGTLSIEVWALKQPYQGDDFNGQPLAGTTIGEILGQHFLAECSYELLFQEPAPGSWYISLMLREWTDAGYVTRDYVNFPVPYVVNWTPSVVRNDNNVISMPNVQPKVEKAAENLAVKKTKSAEAGKTDTTTKVCINTASLEDIAALKGVSKKLAQALFDGRPYADVDELLKIKGVGAKLLRNLSGLISL